MPRIPIEHVVDTTGAGDSFAAGLAFGYLQDADIVRAVEGPLADVRGEAPESLTYPEGTGALQTLWIATRASLRSVLENVTLADIVKGDLPPAVAEYTEQAGAWERR